MVFFVSTDSDACIQTSKFSFFFYKMTHISDVILLLRASKSMTFSFHCNHYQLRWPKAISGSWSFSPHHENFLLKSPGNGFEKVQIWIKFWKHMKYLLSTSILKKKLCTLLFITVCLLQFVGSIRWKTWNFWFFHDLLHNECVEKPTSGVK